MKERRELITLANIVCLEIWKKQKKSLLILLLISLVFSLRSYISIFFSKAIVNMLENIDWNTILIYSSGMLLFQVLTSGLQIYKSYKTVKVDSELEIFSYHKLYDDLARMSLSDREHPEYLSRLHVLSFTISSYSQVFQAILAVFQSLTTFFLVIGYILGVHWSILILIVFMITIKMVIENKISSYRVNLNNSIQLKGQLPNYYNNVLTNASYAKENLLFQTNDFFKKKWTESKQDQNQLRHEMERGVGKLQFANEIFSSTIFSMVTLVTIFLIYQKTITVGDYVAVGLAISYSENSIMGIIKTVIQVKESMKYLKKYQSIVSSYKVADNNLNKHSFSDSISIKNLNYYYPNRTTPSLSSINFELSRGEKIVILGENGAGKSTLIKLILGLYPAPQNTIYYDGIEQHEIDKKQLWRNTSVIFQDYSRYMISVRENMSLGKFESAHDDELIMAHLNRYGLAHLSKLDKGLDSRLGYVTSDSINLSGGQWQRLMLAQAFMRDSQLLILDEPTAALDPNKEIELYEELLSFTREKSMIIISHRIGIARRADRIIMMNDGQIVESGTHDELIKNGKYYYEMWKKQVEWYKIEEAVAT